MKKGKLNNGGFVLVETLIVSVFILGIFAILYNNFYPLIGEYEKREVYDDIDAKYATYWIKRVIQHDSVVFTTSQLEKLNGKANSDGYFLFDCSMVGVASMQNMCKEVVKQSQVMIDDNGTSDESDDFPHIYITNYYLGDKEVEGAPNECGGQQCGFKTLIDRTQNNGKFTGGMHKYLVYLPNYNRWDSLNNAKYRVIVEYHRTRDDNNYVAYSTFEVKK